MKKFPHKTDLDDKAYTLEVYYNKKNVLLAEQIIANKTTKQIAAEMNVDVDKLKSKINNSGTRTDVKNAVNEILKEKIPLLREIAELSLTAIVDKLKELKDPKKNKALLGSMADLKALADLSCKMNEMLRLDLGQSTSNVAVSAQMSLDQTLVIFKELAQKDRVFEYPMLTEGDENSKPLPDSSN